MPHALLVDDDEASVAALAELIGREGFTTDVAGTLYEGRAKMSARPPDLVLIDIHLPDGNGMDLFEDLESRNTTEVVLMTGQPSLQTSIEALRLGAADYLIKPVNIKHLKGILSRVARPADLKAEIRRLHGELRSLGHFGRLIGACAAMQRVYDAIARVGPTTATVLITGESGSGKELAAESVHGLSLRRKELFLPVNCSAVSPQLIESEMFGHEKGSFTGATRKHMGYFERADGGTLFLDEITEMPMELQAKLLRVLETGTFMRVGGDELLETDVRVIAATNRPPEQAVTEGKLREDLLYRLQVFPLYLPPLRERTEDIPLLANHFLAEMNQTEGTAKTLAAELVEQLRRYPWPGNVRELKNMLHRAFIMAEEVIDSHCLAPELGVAPVAAGDPLALRVGMTLADVERRLILATLKHCAGNKGQTAELLGVSVKTLYNRLREYDEH